MHRVLLTPLPTTCIHCCSGAAIQTTFTAATGKNAAVAISGESRIDDNVFGRATNGASGSATEGTVTAIAAQASWQCCHCILGSRGVL